MATPEHDGQDSGVRPTVKKAEANMTCTETSVTCIVACGQNIVIKQNKSYYSLFLIKVIKE
jgi:hypothetical protein